MLTNKAHINKVTDRKEGFVMKKEKVMFGFDRKPIYWILCFGLLLFIVLMIAACGTSKIASMSQNEIQEIYEFQKPAVVRTSEDDNRPQWTHKTVFEESGKIYFTGGFIQGSDYAVTIRCANAEALKNAVQAISLYIRAEFSQYVQGSNAADGAGIERYVEDGIATFSENIHVQGIRQVQVYYEELYSTAWMRSAYNVFVKLEMSKADFLKAKSDVLQKLRDRFNNEGEKVAEQKAQKLLQDLKDEIKTAT